jgi:hypothetical protein
MSDMLQLVADSRRKTSSPDNDKLKHIGHFSVGAEGEIRTLEASLEDSHVSSYITSAKRVWNSWQDSNLQPRRSKRRALPVELQERKKMEHRTGFEPVSDLATDA